MSERGYNLYRCCKKENWNIFYIEEPTGYGYEHIKNKGLSGEQIEIVKYGVENQNVAYNDAIHAIGKERKYCLGADFTSRKCTLQ
jgi:fructosamine-3-kinase